jgi:hypothetical protein
VLPSATVRGTAAKYLVPVGELWMKSVTAGQPWPYRRAMVIYLSIAAAVGVAWTAFHHLLNHPVTEVDRKLSAVDSQLSRDEKMRTLVQV